MHLSSQFFSSSSFYSHSQETRVPEAVKRPGDDLEDLGSSPGAAHKKTVTLSKSCNFSELQCLPLK